MEIFSVFGRLAEETSVRKKTENALADAQRVIADKEALLQDARVTATQHQNSHMDTKRDRDNIQSALTQTQQALDVEVAAKADLQTLANQLKEKLIFQQQLHEKVLLDDTNMIQHNYYTTIWPNSSNSIAKNIGDVMCVGLDELT